MIDTAAAARDGVGLRAYDGRMITPDFDTIEARIRAEADKKMDAAKTLAAARRTLLEAREEFAKTDQKNLDAVGVALAAAKAAGFDDKTLADWNLTDKTTTASSGRKPRKAAAKKPAAPKKSPASTPSTAPAVSGPEGEGGDLSATA